MDTNSVENGAGDGFSNFLTSRQNIVGVVLLSVTVIVHLLVGLGSLWWVAAAAMYGVGVFAVPAPAKKTEISYAPIAPLTATNQPPGALTQSVSDVAHLVRRDPEFPTEFREVLDGIAGSLRTIFEHWDEVSEAPAQRIAVEQICLTYLPQATDAYLNVPPRHRDRQFESRESANQAYQRALTLLEKEVTRVENAALDHSLQELRDQNRYLEQKFGGSILDM